jgi:hypothetical protein
MKKLLSFLLIFFSPSVLFAADVDCSIAKNAMSIASEIRMLKVKREVACKLRSKAQVEQYLRDIIEKKIPKDRLLGEEKIYKLIGLIPFEYPYVDGLISLYTEQLGGYYDAEKKYYAMADWMPGAMQFPIAVHELTHALQDQHFSLDELTSYDKLESDALMARSALVEGDATAVMLDYSRRLMGQKGIATEPNVSGFMAQNIIGAMFSSGFNKAPPALQAMIIFPYISGLNFAHALLRRSGYHEIDKAFSRPPLSTEEILHPIKYFQNQKDFIEISDSGVELENGSEPKLIFKDTLGEFMIVTLLSSWISSREASSAATGWGGDRIFLYELSNKQSVLIWKINWDTAADAIEFWRALVKSYSKRFSISLNESSKELSFTDKNAGEVKLTLSDKLVSVRFLH